MDNFTIYKREATVVATADIDMKKQYKRMGYIECGDFQVSSAEEAIELYNKKRSNLMSKSSSEKNSKSLVNCSDCSERISAKAKTCPHCGAKGISVVKKEKGVAIGCSIFIAVPIFFFLVAVLSGGDEEEIKVTTKKAPISYSDEAIERLIHHSDDYIIYKEDLKWVTRNLIERRICKPENGFDIKEFGWSESQTSTASTPVYFTYCYLDLYGKRTNFSVTTDDRIYFEIKSRRIYR